MEELKLCKYCGGDIAIRNPTGKCDHLYYPDMIAQGKVELKSCPFCGNKDIKVLYRGRNYVCFCYGCDVEMYVRGDECASHRQDAIDQWNRRV
jgi:Lar family restriction alleviation protein